MTITAKRAGHRDNPAGPGAWAFSYQIERDGQTLTTVAARKEEVLEQALALAMPGERIEYHTHDLSGKDKVEVVREEQASLTEQVIGPGGLLSRELPGYEPRPQQMQMALLVEQAIHGGDHAVIEAGTGTGKSFAYLLPAVLSGKRVIVSTANLALQGQLRDKDLPFLVSLEGKQINKGAKFPGFTWAVAKGKSNFACRRKVQLETGVNLLPRQDMHGWYNTTATGDIEELPYILEPKERESLVVDDDCLRKHCPLYDTCFYYAAKARWANTDVIVINHALLALDLVLGAISENATILPRADVLVIDEAHQLESYAVSAYSTELTIFAVLRGLRNHDELHGQADKLFADLKEFMVSKATGIFRGQDITVQPDLVFEAGRDLANQVYGIANDLWSPAQMPHNAEEQKAANAASQLRSLADKLQAVSMPTAGGFVRHVQEQNTKKGETVTTGCNTRWDVAAFLGQLTARYDSVIYTSATLAVGKAGFTMFKNRVGIVDAPPVTGREIHVCIECGKTYPAETAECECGCTLFHHTSTDSQPQRQVLELEVPSPFDYQRNCLLYLPQGMRDPNDKLYLNSCIEQCEQLIEASHGRAFVLCTSNYAMNILYEALRNKILHPIRRQGDYPKPVLMEWFKSTQGAVLVATKSFWEGVDVRGETLSLVIIDKLPFPVPSDPPFAARCEAWDKANPDKSSFMWISLPEAILQLKQGFGRLIRTQTDRGVVAILDPRLETKRYGSGVLNALPPAKRTASIEDVKRFFGES